MEKLCLIDAEDNNEYELIVNHEDAEKARRGINTINIINQYIIY